MAKIVIHFPDDSNFAISCMLEVSYTCFMHEYNRLVFNSLISFLFLIWNKLFCFVIETLWAKNFFWNSIFIFNLFNFTDKEIGISINLVWYTRFGYPQNVSNIPISDFFFFQHPFKLLIWLVNLSFQNNPPFRVILSYHN